MLYKVSGIALFCGVAMACAQPLSLVHNGRGCAAALGPCTVASIEGPREATGFHILTAEASREKALPREPSSLKESLWL